jgi:4-azaleucine resistance transporter AzlC
MGLRDGARAAMPLVLPTFALAVSFGLLARGLGWGAAAPVVMSLVVFSGSAQFAVAGVLGAGGGVLAAVASAALVNARFVPMGLAAGPALRGGPVRRALEGQAVVDGSLVVAERAGRVDRGRLLGATLPQFVAWQAGTAVGALGLLGGLHPEALGLDVLFPVFFLGLLLGELREPRARRVALLGAALALVLVPLTPPGVPVLAAAALALLGLRR